jgi:putative restriction endonuclease
MARLSKAALLQVIVDALTTTGASVLLLRRDHPFELSVTRRGHAFRARIYIWNITHGGGAMRAADEFRIQITGVSLPLDSPAGYRMLILGWEEKTQVFAAFDPRYHHSPSSASPSIQISRATLDRAATTRAIVLQRRGNDEIAAALPPTLLAVYCEAQPAIHALAATDARLLQAVLAGNQPSEPELAGLPPDRRRLITLVSALQRDARFREQVLHAYASACAVCGTQLNLVEAAHIVPVAIPGSTDETSNGIALCSLHHDAYDQALIGITDNYDVVVSQAALADLSTKGLAGGDAALSNGLRQRIALPATQNDQPNPRYLRQGLAVRRWRP